MALGASMGVRRCEKPPVTAPTAPTTPAASATGALTTAAEKHGWGRPVEDDDFTGKRLDPDDWTIYDGPGHAGKGRRSPSAVAVRGGVLTITGTPDGTTGGLSWLPGARKHGRWEARVRMDRACACYHPVLLLWPVRGGGGVAPRGGGGEIDYLEVTDDGTRRSALFFLHYGSEREHRQLSTRVETDLTRWHAFAVEWTSRAVTGYIDGRVWFRSDDPATLPPGKMGQAIQLDWFPEDAGRTHRDVPRDARATLQVDWIRMYRL
ncbi:glycoside hydrolase family 16 protein [Actinomadura kijaniata]|uniref:glycoside hydrolase family 16 protein n=1 Tax=Actinomadura kijaniata TaxID=46161 RepID=UPI0014709FA7|nr:glycoside hydrolase family 16 protein [Actinomadura kijaniata]